MWQVGFAFPDTEQQRLCDAAQMRFRLCRGVHKSFPLAVELRQPCGTDF